MEMGVSALGVGNGFEVLSFRSGWLRRRSQLADLPSLSVHRQVDDSVGSL